jgi:hypothetical protein
MPKPKVPNAKEINTLHNATVCYIQQARKVLGASFYFPEYTKQVTIPKQMAAHMLAAKAVHDYITANLK